MAAIRRSQANEAPPTGGPPWWRAYLEAGGPRCAYCRRAVGWERLTRDHVVPRSRGGRDTPDNVLPACRSCNRRKRSRRLMEFARDLDALRPETLPPHPLGHIEEGVWAWSEEARRIQDEARAARPPR